MLFVTFEGPDGAGKTTQIALLVERLIAEEFEVVSTREPGGTPVGAQLRAMLLDADEPLTAASEAFLMSADRAEHVRRVIRPALEAGKVVVSDRYLDSTLAYQGGGRGLPLDVLQSMQSLATGGLLPDLTFLLDLPVETGLARKLEAHDVNRMDQESVEFHRRVASTFHQLVAADPARWRVVDATQSVQMVHTAIWSHVSAHLEVKRSALIRGEV